MHSLWLFAVFSFITFLWEFWGIRLIHSEEAVRRLRKTALVRTGMYIVLFGVIMLIADKLGY